MMLLATAEEHIIIAISRGFVPRSIFVEGIMGKTWHFLFVQYYDLFNSMEDKFVASLLSVLQFSPCVKMGCEKSTKVILQ